MDRFLLGHASAHDWQHAVGDCLHQIGAIPAGTSVGFVYATDAFAQDLTPLLHRLRQETGVAHWVGSIGLGVCATHHAYEDVPALAVLLACCDDSGFLVLPTVRSRDEALAASTQRWLHEHHARFAVVHGDPGNARLPEIIDSVSESMAGGFLVGGLTSSRHGNYQIADRVTEGGLSGVLFGNSVAVVTGLTQGCSPIGTAHEVTDSRGSIVARLDNRPALEVLKGDVGEVLARDLNRIAGYIFAGIPVAGSDTGDYLVRNLIGIDLKQNLIAVGDVVSPGQRLVFCRRDGQSAAEDMQRMLVDLKRRLPGPPKGGLYYSCLGRGAHMFGSGTREVQMISAELGDFPFAGFYANGEISHNRLYGFTGVLTLFV